MGVRAVVFDQGEDRQELTFTGGRRFAGVSWLQGAGCAPYTKQEKATMLVIEDRYIKEVMGGVQPGENNDTCVPDPLKNLIPSLPGQQSPPKESSDTQK